MQTKNKFISARLRQKVSPMCFCGEHTNKDGKCAPTNEEGTAGYCHSCQKFFDLTDSEKPAYTPKKEEKPIDYHSFELVEKSQKNEGNNLFNFIYGIFSPEVAQPHIAKYFGSSSKFWQGATVFWQVDNLNQVRYGKVMLYDSTTGKRVKEPFAHFTTIHKILKLDNFNYKQCLFGLHLINGNTKPVALVESEKTAIIMSIVDDSYLWLATGGKGNFNYEFLAPIKGREITAFPDAGETLWSEIAEKLNGYGFNIVVSNALEEYPQGTDLADLVINEMMQPITAKNGNAENQQVTEETSSTRVEDLERIKVGLTFSTKGLKELAKKMIPENDSCTAKELIQQLYVLEGLQGEDATDLILTMRIKDIIDKTSLGTYFLTDSTPF